MRERGGIARRVAQFSRCMAAYGLEHDEKYATEV